MASMELGMPERRVHGRVPLRCRVHLEFQEQRCFLSEETVDVSAGGMFLTSENPRQEGDRLLFDLKLTSRGPVITGTGEVAWVRQEGEASGVGVRFLDLDSRGAVLLMELTAGYERGGEAELESLVEAAAQEWADGGFGEPVMQELVDTEEILPETQELEPEAGEDRLDFPTPPSGLAPIRPADPVDLDDTAETEIDHESGPAGPGHDIDDVLSKTWDIGASRSVEALRARSDATRPFPWPMVVAVALAAGVGSWWWAQSSAERAGESPRAAVAVPLGEGAPEPTGALSTAASETAPATRWAPSATDSRESYGSIRDIRWRPDGDDLVVLIELDGSLSANSYRHHRPPELPPREVLQLFGAREKFAREQIEVDSDLVEQIRFGFHSVEGTAEQWVVFDLGSEAVRLRSVENQGPLLRVRFEASGGEAFGAAEGASAALPPRRR